MSPTGSTSEQKSRTEWQVRLGLVLVVGVLLLIATSASAGWGTRSVPGSPNDVRIWAPGVFSVATDSGAYLEHADGGTVFINTPDKTSGTYHNPSTGCFMALRETGDERGITPCGTNATIMRTGDLRATTNEAGVAFVMLKDDVNAFASHLFRASAPGVSPWVEIDPFIEGKISNALAALNMGGSEHVLLGTKTINSTNDGKLYWYLNGVEVASYAFPDPGPFPGVRDSEALDLFPAGGSTPTALFSWANGLYRGTLVAGQNPFSAISFPGGNGTVTALDVNTGAGTRYGDGFGMATVQRDGGVTLLSAVPAARPEDIGSEWRINPTLPPGLTAPRSLECYGASFCVIAHNSPAANNVYVYTNDAPPTLTVTSGAPDPFTLPSGTSRTVDVRAPDPDGDAVLLTVVPSSFSRDGVSMSTTAVAGGVDIALGAGLLCSDILQPIRITATDGLDSHAVVDDYVLKAQRVAPPSTPVITPSANIAVPAGSGPRELMASSSSLCGIKEFTWTAVSPDDGLLSLSGMQNERAVFSPPRTVCDPLGETHVYRVLALEDGGVSSLPTDVTIQVLPWGAPNAPFNGGLSVTLLAGDSVNGSTELRPNSPHHECDRPATGFPGVDTVWQIGDAGLPPPGVRLRAEGGALITGSSAVTPALRIETDACAHAEFDLTVQHYTQGGFGDGGPESNVHVTVDPDLNPVSEATLQLVSRFASPESVAGTASVSGLRCPELREDKLRARISLTNDGGVVREGIFPVPGAWQFTLGNACQGATYELQGELLVDGGLRGGSLPGGEQGLRGPSSVVVSGPITVPAVQQATLRPMEAPSLTARCGQPAMGVLEQRALQPCSELPVSWTQVGGIALTQPSYTGQRIEVATQDTDFGELIGQSVVMRMSVKALEETWLDQEVPILTEPFVELRRHTEKATGTNVDLVGVSVELRNTTDCGVRQVEHQERLEGVDYVPGSARFNGSSVEAEAEGDTLTVRGIVLEGSTTGRLTYVVRPRLLESSRFEGQAFVRGVPVSQALEEPPSGCGCSGAGSGLAGLGLAGLALALRRRRRR